MRSTHPLPPSAQDDYPGLYSGLRRRPPAPAGLQAPSQRALVGDQPATGSLCWVMLIPGRGLGILGAGESVSQTTFSLYLDRGHTYLTSAAARLGSLFVWFLPQRLASLVSCVTEVRTHGAQAPLTLVLESSPAFMTSSCLHASGPTVTHLSWDRSREWCHSLRGAGCISSLQGGSWAVLQS